MWFVRLDREIDTIAAKQSAVRVHIERLTSLRRDTRKAHVALLESWVAGSAGTEGAAASIEKMVGVVVDEHTQFHALEPTDPKEAELRDSLAQAEEAWSEAMTTTLREGRGAERLSTHQGTLAAVDREADAILKLNSGLGQSLDKRSDTLGKLERRVEQGFVAAAAALVAVGLLWLTRRRSETLLARAALREEERLAKQRAEFFSSMSHELRTPLVSISNLAATLDHDAERSAREEVVVHIDQEARALLHMINNVLDLAKLESPEDKFLIEEVVLADALGRCIARCRPLLRGKSVTLNLEIADRSIVVKADFVKLQQVFTNLIANAIKFTSEGRVDVRIGAEKEGAVTVEVVDTGVGMGEAELAKIWRPFEQGDEHTAKKFGGTGLGLSIVKRVLDRLGGDVAVRSEKGAGTTFAVTLPVAQRASAAS